MSEPTVNHGLTKAQIEMLLRPVSQNIIESKQSMSYVPTHEVKAALTRIFGPGNWDHTIHDVELMYEVGPIEKGHPMYPSSGKKPVYWVAGYSTACTLRIRDYWGNPLYETTEYHAEENAPLPNRGEARAMALTSCQSYALRRAALDLGDAMGLHLYNKGSVTPLVGRTGLLLDPDSPKYQQPKQEDALAAAKANNKNQEEAPND